MASEQQMEVYRQMRTSQDKYSYFLLAAVGAAIGFALNQTNGKSLSLSQVPLGLGVFLWSLSFYFGCKHLAYVSSTLFGNSELLLVQSGQHPKAGKNPQLVQAASEGIRDAIESNSDMASCFARWQFRSFVLGGMSYIAWHVWEMWLRVP